MEEEELHEIERRAMAALMEAPDFIWDRHSLPVPVEDIIDSHFGLHVREVEDMGAAPDCPPIGPGQSISGLLLAARKEIWVNADEVRQWPVRRRFTIGHELGHWVLHRDQQASLFCRHATVDPEEGRPKQELPPLARIEQEANHFAAAVLMPRPMLEARYRELAGDREAFHKLCRAFHVSGQAMSRRLRQVIPPKGGGA